MTQQQGVNVSMNGCLFLYVNAALDWGEYAVVYPTSYPITA